MKKKGNIISLSFAESAQSMLISVKTHLTLKAPITIIVVCFVFCWLL